MVDTVSPHPRSGPDGVGEAGARVAVLMRTRDRPVLLSRALASVLSQRHGTWHLFLVNDGGEAAAVEALLSRQETGLAGRVTVLHHEASLGRPAAANAALHLMSSAQGGFAFVALHDDDDSWHPDFLSQAIAWLARPAHASFVAVLTRWRVVHERVDADGVIEDRSEDAAFDMPVLAFDAMLGCNRLPIGTVLFRRAATDAAGPFDADMPMLEDWAFMLRVLAQGDIGVLAERLACHHRRDADTLPAYRNSAHEKAAWHEIAVIRDRNARLRAVLERDPGALVLLGVLGYQAEGFHRQAEHRHDRILANLDRNGLWGHARHEDLQHRLVRVERMLSELVAGLASTPEPPPPPARPLWRRAARRLAGPLIDRARRHSA